MHLLMWKMASTLSISVCFFHSKSGISFCTMMMQWLLIQVEHNLLNQQRYLLYLVFSAARPGHLVFVWQQHRFTIWGWKSASYISLMWSYCDCSSIWETANLLHEGHKQIRWSRKKKTLLIPDFLFFFLIVMCSV